MKIWQSAPICKQNCIDKEIMSRLNVNNGSETFF